MRNAPLEWSDHVNFSGDDIHLILITEDEEIPEPEVTTEPSTQPPARFNKNDNTVYKGGGKDKGKYSYDWFRPSPTPNTHHKDFGIYKHLPLIIHSHGDAVPGDHQCKYVVVNGKEGHRTVLHSRSHTLDESLRNGLPSEHEIKASYTIIKSSSIGKPVIKQNKPIDRPRLNNKISRPGCWDCTYTLWNHPTPPRPFDGWNVLSSAASVVTRMDYCNVRLWYYMYVLISGSIIFIARWMF